jgi:hypothetical protein
MARYIRKTPVKPYPPDRRLVTLLTKLLQYKADVNDREIVDKERKRYLDKEKVEVLNECIFPSMANLTFFFKSISKYPELKEVFEDDIKDLLGVRRKDPQQNSYGFIFSQLLRSILLIEEEVDGEEFDREEVVDKKIFPLHYQLASADNKDFRLWLNQILQQIVRDKVVAHLTKAHENDKADQYEKADQIVKDEFDRVWIWTRILAAGINQAVEEDKALPRRTIKFGTIQLRENEDPI